MRYIVPALLAAWLTLSGCTGQEPAPAPNTTEIGGTTVMPPPVRYDEP